MSKQTIEGNSLIQTSNGKRFFANSGLITVATSEVSLLEIKNIGERDIKISFELGTSVFTTDALTIKVYINDVLTYINAFTETTRAMTGYNELTMIVPANSSLKYTAFWNTSSYGTLVSAYGKYLSMEPDE